MNKGCIRNCRKGDCNGDCKNRAGKGKQAKMRATPNKGPKPGNFGYHLRTDLLALAIKKARKERALTREEFGMLLGIKKSQIARLETHLTNAKMDSIIKVFQALNIKLDFSVELPDKTVTLI